MNWTTTPPTKPGFYAWRASEDSIVVCDYIDVESIMESFEENGEWLRLVPAEEVEKAYREGAHHSMLLQGEIDYEWNHSRAKQIAEGTL